MSAPADGRRLSDRLANGALALLVALSLGLNYQLWLVDLPRPPADPGYGPPALAVEPPAEAFWPRDIFLHLGTGAHARVSDSDPVFQQLWRATLAVVAALDRDQLALLARAPAAELLAPHIARTPGWGAVFDVALPLDWWWEMWSQEPDIPRLELTSAPREGFPQARPGPDPQAVHYRVARALVPVDRVQVFFAEDDVLEVFLGDGNRWLVARAALTADDGLELLDWPARLRQEARNLPTYRGVPPTWLEAHICSTVLVPELEVFRSPFLYIRPGRRPDEAAIGSFFLDAHAVSEIRLNGVVGYTDGRHAVRVYPSGALSFFSGLTPSEGASAPWGWAGAIREAAWHIDHHGGWPDGARLSDYWLVSGEQLAEAALEPLTVQLGVATDFSSYLAGGPWPEEIWGRADGMGFSVSTSIGGAPLGSPSPVLEAVVGRRGLITYTRLLPEVVGSAGESRTKAPFGAIADALGYVPPAERADSVVTGVHMVYFLPSTVLESTHLTAAWAVSFAGGDVLYIHATTGSLLGRGR